MDTFNNVKTTYAGPAARENRASEIISNVYAALKQKGYNPQNQLVGYIMSGDPTYITNFGGARQLITEIERDELLEEFIGFYLSNLDSEEKA